MNSYTNDIVKIGKPTANGGVYQQVNILYNTDFLRELYRGFMMNILLDTFAKEFTNVKDINKIKDIKMIDNNFIVLDVQVYSQISHPSH